jgi:hypothetical protein
MSGLQADISDGKGFFTGMVTDISRFGMSLNDVPARLNPEANILSVIVEGPGAHFKLLVKQKWETSSGHYKVIGGEIENSPWNWTEFVMQYEPDENDLLS